MKKSSFLILAMIIAASSFAQQLLPGYNNAFYPTVLQAAKGVAMPFLLQQHYATMAGVTVTDSTLSYNGNHYAVHEIYLNPATGYYVAPAVYSNYGITNFSGIWPSQFPNVLYDASANSFNAQSDCVGYLTRLLSATGDTAVATNAYLSLISATHAANKVPFAYRGYVATAYSFAVAFPTLPATAAKGWMYISGNVEAAIIDTYNHTKVSSLGTYNGVRKGGFANALPGDVLAFGYSAASSSNGHVMVLETAPQKLTADSLPRYFPAQTMAQASALLSTHYMYSVPVFDCSGKMAHYSDSRTQMSGIGHGKLILITDKTDDAPTGFIFDSVQVTGTKLHYDTLGTGCYAFSVGRFVGATTAVHTAPALPAIHVYPSPAHKTISVLLPQNAAGEITIVNATGRVCYRQKVAATSISVDVAALAAGAYWLQYLNDRGETISVKWLKE